MRNDRRVHGIALTACLFATTFCDSPHAQREHQEPPIAVPTVPPADLAATIEEVMEERVAAGRFSGSVIVAKDGEPLFAKAWGFADRERKIPNTLDTPMPLASMNKMFTGLAIAQLVEAGKLDYDDLVGEHLPDFPMEDVREKVTLHHLLTHTAGLGMYFTQDYMENKDWILTHEDFVGLFSDQPLRFEPGERMEYSNNGPVVLGRVIEAVSDESYYDYVRAHVYEPAGMKNTDHYLLTDEEAGLAIGYYCEELGGPWIADTPMKGAIGSAAGSGYASANDLLRFSKAILAEELLSREALEVVWKPHVDEGMGFSYGYLWGGASYHGFRTRGHNGGGGGAATDFKIFPELGVTVIVLSNFGGMSEIVTEFLKELVALSYSAGDTEEG